MIAVQKPVLRDPGYLHRIPKKKSEFFHPKSRIQAQKDSGSWIPAPDPHQWIYVFLALKTVSKVSEKWSGMFNPDHGSGFFSTASNNTCVRRGPDRIGSLGKPPASSPLLPSRASSRTRLPTFPTHQCRYEAIRVWSYSTFIAYGSQSWEN